MNVIIEQILYFNTVTYLKLIKNDMITFRTEYFEDIFTLYYIIYLFIMNNYVK